MQGSGRENRAKPFGDAMNHSPRSIVLSVSGVQTLHILPRQLKTSCSCRLCRAGVTSKAGIGGGLSTSSRVRGHPPKCWALV